MVKFIESHDEDGNLTSIITHYRGLHLLGTSELNKGSAFSSEERERFHLSGRLPYSIETLEQQVDRLYKQYQLINDNLHKNIFLNALKQHNETSFYALVSQYLDEMLPIIYTPTIGDAVKNFSFSFNKPTGIFISYPDIDKIDSIINNIILNEVDIVLITDGEGVLGIGDWGAGAIDICIGKLMVYTLCAGIDPGRVLPIQLDCGTNNQDLINDPMYLGWRHERISGKCYDVFIDKALRAIKKRFPDVFIHFEDFGRSNARRVLETYRQEFVSFNDDIQGTGATATACILSALKASNEAIKDQRFVFFGGGSAGIGVADQVFAALVQSGIDPHYARQQFWVIDRDGLICEGMDNITSAQAPYARQENDLQAADLVTVVKQVKPTVLIGCSTVKGAFTKEVICTMAQYVAQPIIFPLSNPTSLAEATPKDIIEWTQGHAIVATGSPFDPVIYNGKSIRISQCNNAFMFPGIGLGVLASRATEVTDHMIGAASHALSDWSPALEDPSAPVLPDFDQIHDVSRYVALKVAEQAKADGVSRISDNIDLEKHIRSIFWEPKYYHYEWSESELT